MLHLLIMPETAAQASLQPLRLVKAGTSRTSGWIRVVDLGIAQEARVNRMLRTTATSVWFAVDRLGAQAVHQRGDALASDAIAPIANRACSMRVPANG
jgi:hypothetical protein